MLLDFGTCIQVFLERKQPLTQLAATLISAPWNVICENNLSAVGQFSGEKLSQGKKRKIECFADYTDNQRLHRTDQNIADR